MERNYTITLKNDTSTSKSNPIANNEGKSDTQNAKESVSKENIKALGTALVAYRTVKSFAVQNINYNVSTVALRTGSNEMQERANFINSMAQKGVGIIESVGIGFATGGAVGAIAGLLLSTAHTAVSYMQAQNTINLQQQLENQSITANYIRAGANGSRH